MSFELDDWPHFQFNFDPTRVGLSAPSKVLEIWQGELDWACTREPAPESQRQRRVLGQDTRRAVVWVWICVTGRGVALAA
jgi:hypothetical protein